MSLLGDKINEPKLSMDFSIKPITADAKLKVLGFMKKNFFKDEPLNNSVNLIDGKDTTCIELEEYSMSSLDENLSLMAVSSSGIIVGVIINGKTEIPDINEEPDYIKNCENKKFKKIMKLLHYVDQEINIPEKYPDSNCLDIKIVSVDNNWRGKGIASALFKKTIEIGKELGFNLIRTDCSSHFTARLCQRIGFHPIYELKYSEYLDDNEQPVFTPAPPHNSIVTYILKI
ncbi:hypothetical protein HCN44_002918 [Aphidius gifuensis]|uniref:aralkylamine N-acetyltransferase n=1 Tax=Aphidius gifuensis TaxID=684658 RepID=A0A834XSG8_APHGI|nr:arylalkylamine N-acetyltransferase 1-like isoform X2 [Aphidius gifuensis]KAF7991356.1 hypothetical protein HCN44_002918 [Aphidius gifuensis]